jgi:hypothetical protein
MTAIAPTTSSHRKYRLPCLVMLPSLSCRSCAASALTRSRLQDCAPRRTSSSRRSRQPLPWRRPGRCLGSPQPSARHTRAVQDYDALVDGYDLGTNRAMLVRQHIENAADGAETRLSAPSAMILSNSPVPLRPLADTMPSSDKCPCRASLNIVHWRTSNCRARCSINPSS